MAYYWPQYGVAIEVDDDPYLLLLLPSQVRQGTL